MHFGGVLQAFCNTLHWIVYGSHCTTLSEVARHLFSLTTIQKCHTIPIYLPSFNSLVFCCPPIILGIPIILFPSLKVNSKIILVRLSWSLAGVELTGPAVIERLAEPFFKIFQNLFFVRSAEPWYELTCSTKHTSKEMPELDIKVIIQTIQLSVIEGMGDFVATFW